MEYEQPIVGLRRWSVLLVAALILGVAAPAGAQKPAETETQLGKEAREIDASASRADSARVSRRIAEEFSAVQVKSSATDPNARPLTLQDVHSLRSKGLGYGEITNLLALYSRQSGSTFYTIDQIREMKRSGQGWGQIAKVLGIERLGAVRRDVKRTDHAVRALAQPANAGEQKHASQLQAEAKRVDAGAAAAGSTPEGQRRVTQAIAKEFKVDESVVTSLRNRGLGFGEVAITLALADELPKRGMTDQDAMKTILDRRAAGQGWGQIAHDLDLKLGRVLSTVKKAQKEVAHAEGARAAKAERPERSDRPGKPDKPEKPERAERAGR
jgi:hypothetical protein